ncbi:MAG: carbon-nitrogen hydrolase family protein [Arachnia sp.]
MTRDSHRTEDSPEVLRLAVAQVCAGEDPLNNLVLIRDAAARAQQEGAKLVVFPEATMASFTRRSVDVAEPVNGPWVSGVQDIARENGIAMIVGMFTPGTPHPDEPERRRARNTLVCVDAGGEVVLTYDKIHLFDAWGFVESRHVEAGHEPVVACLAGTSIGVAICYDVRFPGMATFLAGMGAQVIVVSASWANGPGKAEQWRALCIARAMDSTCFVVGAGQADPASVGMHVPSGSPTGVGHSLVVNPLGDVVAEAGAAPELLMVDVDLAEVAEARGRVPVLESSRFSVAAPSGPLQ